MTTKIEGLLATGVVTLALGSWALPALAALPLEGRTISGGKVNAYDASAVMIYDPNADLTWLRDWNVNGARPWADQMAWASSVQVGTFANWSLPSARNRDGSGPCSGYGCTESQMGYLWYEVLGNTAGSFTNAGPFQNMQSDPYYTDTEYDPGYAYFFITTTGWQYCCNKYDARYAVVVRPGDVVAVPEPQIYAMLLLGVGAVLVVARRRRPG
jgi:PEP-CTERM motif